MFIFHFQETVEDDAEPSASDESDVAEQIPDLIENDKDEAKKTPSPKKESVAANTRKRKPRKE